MCLKTARIAFVLCTVLFATGRAWSQPMRVQPETQPPLAPVAANQQKHQPKASPEEIAAWQAQAIEYFESGDYLGFVQTTIRLRKERPWEEQYMVGMVVGGALLGRPNTAYNSMHIMQQQGLSYDFNSTEDTQSIRGTEVYDYLNGLLIEAANPMGEGRVAFTLADAAAQPEAIAWDDSRGSFLVGSVETGAVLAVTPGGDVTELVRANADNGVLAVTGLAVDAERKKLWVSSAGVRAFAGLNPADLGSGALFEFELDSLKLLKRYDIPVDGLPHAPGNLELTPEGDIYMVDRAVPMVFRKMARAENLEAFLASKEMTGFTDLALSGTGKTLYVADGELGIVVADLESGKASPITAPETLNLGGISGLSFGEGSLLMIQNRISPQRLMRLELDPTGREVTRVSPIAIALQEFNSPAFGTVQGGALYYFAGSNQPDETRQSTPVIVMKSPLELSAPIVPAEQRKYDKDIAEKKKKSGQN